MVPVGGWAGRVVAPVCPSPCWVLQLGTMIQITSQESHRTTTLPSSELHYQGCRELPSQCRCCCCLLQSKTDLIITTTALASQPGSPTEHAHCSYLWLDKYDFSKYENESSELHRPQLSVSKHWYSYDQFFTLTLILFCCVFSILKRSKISVLYLTD